MKSRILIASMACLLISISVYGQNYLKLPKTDDSRSLVICYVKIYARIIDLKKKKEQGYVEVTVLNKNGVKSYFVGTDTSYVLREDFIPVIGGLFEYTPAKTGVDVNIKMQIVKYGDGYILVFTNIPPGLFKLTKLQERKNDSPIRTNECKYCSDINLSTNVQAGEIHFMGSFQFNVGFNYVYYQEFEKIGKVIVSDFIRNEKNNGYTHDQSLNQIIPLETPKKDELIKIIEKKAGEDWLKMLNKSLEEGALKDSI